MTAASAGVRVGCAATLVAPPPRISVRARAAAGLVVAGRSLGWAWGEGRVDRRLRRGAAASAPAGARSRTDMEPGKEAMPGVNGAPPGVNAAPAVRGKERASERRGEPVPAAVSACAHCDASVDERRVRSTAATSGARRGHGAGACSPERVCSGARLGLAPELLLEPARLIGAKAEGAGITWRHGSLGWRGAGVRLHCCAGASPNKSEAPDARRRRRERLRNKKTKKKTRYKNK